MFIIVMRMFFHPPHQILHLPKLFQFYKNYLIDEIAHLLLSIYNLFFGRKRTFTNLTKILATAEECNYTKLLLKLKLILNLTFKSSQ